MSLAHTVHDLDNHQMPMEFLFPDPISDTYSMPCIGRCEALRRQQVGQRATGQHEAFAAVLLGLTGIQDDPAQFSCD